MDSKSHVWRAIGFAALLAASHHLTADAQELDTAIQAYRMVAVLMGQVSSTVPVYTHIDSTYDIPYALNAGLRQVSIDIPFRVRDTITVVAQTQEYVLETRFMETADFGYPFEVWRKTPDGTRLYGMKRNAVADFDLPTGTRDAFEYAIMDSTIIINPPYPEFASVYIEGRGVPATTITHSKILFANTGIPRTDRIAVVYWAIYTLANPGSPLSQTYLDKYNAFVGRRTGQPRVGVPQ